MQVLWLVSALYGECVECLDVDSGINARGSIDND